jgi:hypothetical protein
VHVVPCADVSDRPHDYLGQLETLRLEIARKLFGDNEVGAQEELDDGTAAPRPIGKPICGYQFMTLSPDSRFRLYWDGVGKMCCLQVIHLVC